MSIKFDKFIPGTKYICKGYDQKFIFLCTKRTKSFVFFEEIKGNGFGKEIRRRPQFSGYPPMETVTVEVKKDGGRKMESTLYSEIWTR